MKIERKKARGAEVYTASLNDIMFFLLLFFLIISTMATPMAIKVMLPKSSTSEQIAAKKPINVVIAQNKRYYIDESEVAFNEIEPTLVRLTGGNAASSGYSVLLQVDHQVDIQTVVAVLDIGNRLNLNVTMVVEKQ